MLAVNFATHLRTIGATTNTVGKAIGQAVAKPLAQRIGKSAFNPCVTIISGAVVLVTQGLNADFPVRWAKGFATAWPIAFPTVLVVAPMVRKWVARMTSDA